MDELEETRLRAEYRNKEAAYAALVAGNAEWASRWRAAVACATAARALAEFWEAAGDDWDLRAAEGAGQNGE